MNHPTRCPEKPRARQSRVCVQHLHKIDKLINSLPMEAISSRVQVPDDRHQEDQSHKPKPHLIQAKGPGGPSMSENRDDNADILMRLDL